MRVWKCEHSLAPPQIRHILWEMVSARGAREVPVSFHKAVFIEASRLVPYTECPRLAGFEVFAGPEGGFMSETLVLTVAGEFDLDQIYVEIARGEGIVSEDRGLFRFLSRTRSWAFRVNNGESPGCYYFARTSAERERLAAYCEEPEVAEFLREFRA